MKTVFTSFCLCLGLVLFALGYVWALDFGFRHGGILGAACATLIVGTIAVSSVRWGLK